MAALRGHYTVSTHKLLCWRGENYLQFSKDSLEFAKEVLFVQLSLIDKDTYVKVKKIQY